MAGRLDGKVAVITGGTSGIGEATVELFARGGASVVFTGRNADSGNRIEKNLAYATPLREQDCLATSPSGPCSEQATKAPSSTATT